MVNCEQCQKRDVKLCRFCMKGLCTNHMKIHKQHSEHIVARVRAGVRPEDDPT